FTNHYGAAAANQPFLVVSRIPAPGEKGEPPYAVLVASDDYDKSLKDLAKMAVKPKAQPEGFDRITDEDGRTIFTVKGDGYIAFGSQKSLMASIAKPKAALATALSPDLQSRLFQGDVSLYLNLAAIQTLYGDQINQAREGLLGALDQGAQAGNSNMMEAAKSIYG